MTAKISLLAGTRKGAFIYSSDEKRERWELSEPILPGWSIYHMCADERSSPPRLYMAANHWAWGPSVAKSTDMGKTWDWVSQGLGFPQDMEVTIQNVWCVTPGHESEPGVVYCGTQPAGLFRSVDWGVSWAPVEGINRHPQRQYWTGTGGGDSCVHSIEIDPRDASHVYLSISAGGSYATRDGGETWEMFSHTALAATPDAIEEMGRVSDMMPRALPPDVDPLAIEEMHKMRVHPKDPDRLWAQAHMGVFRSDDAGATWADVTEGLPSFHGFPIATKHHDPDVAYVVPLQYLGDNFRVAPGQFAVYRTSDGGGSWDRLTRGLPGPNNYQSVYREGLDTDGLDQEGVYVATSNGQVFASPDGGEEWHRLPGDLPPVLSISCLVT